MYHHTAFIYYMTNKEFTDLFMKMEQEYHLFKIEYDGVYIWKLLRIYIYGRISQRLFNTGEYHPKVKNEFALFSKLKEEFLRITHNGFKDKSCRENIVIRHRRRILVDEEYIDVNTEYLSEVDGSVNYDNTEFIEFGCAYKYRNISKKTRIVATGKLNVLKKKLFYKYLMHRSLHRLVSNIEEIIKEVFHVDISIKGLVIEQLALFKEGYKVYNRYFSIKHPKRVYIVCSYGKEYIIDAAHNNGAEVIEIQHGILGTNHLGYSFPFNNSMTYFPDKIYVYGEYWKKAVHFPIDENKVIVAGNPYYLHEVSKYIKLEREKKQVLFISSGGYGKELSHIACSILLMDERLRIVYKMHPSEFGIWRDIYNELYDVSINNPERMKVVEDGVALYELFSKSKYIVGVNSTALYESIIFNPTIAIMNLASIENVSALIKKYSIPVLCNAEELYDFIKINRDEVILENPEYFYKVKGYPSSGVIKK